MTVAIYKPNSTTYQCMRDVNRNVETDPKPCSWFISSTNPHLCNWVYTEDNEILYCCCANARAEYDNNE